MGLASSLLRLLTETLMARLSCVWLKLWLRLARRDTLAARRLMSLAQVTRDRAAARLAGRVLLEASPSDAALIEELGWQYLLLDDPETARRMYVNHARLVNDAIEPRLCRNAYMEPDRVSRCEPYVHVLRNVELETDYCAIAEGDKVYILETSGKNFGKHPYVRHRMTPDLESFLASWPAASRSLDQPFVLLGTDGGTNYSHWLARHVLKLALLEKAGVTESLPLLVNEDLRGYQVDLLDLLGISRDRLLPMPTGLVVRCREIIVPVLLMHHRKMRFGIDWLRERLASLLEPPASAQDLLFVSRRDSPNRVLLNEAEIADALTRRGFKTIVPGEMRFAEQVRSFSRARMVVGAHGAGLTNVMFAPAHARVLEIRSTNVFPMNDFQFISGQMGLEFREIVSDRYGEAQRTRYQHNHDFYVDADAVIKTVDRMLEGARAR